jgi:hypothetical protein
MNKKTLLNLKSKRRKLMDKLKVLANWVKARLGERTSWDGMTIIVVCGSVVILGGLTKWLAWAGLVYGVYTLVKEQA